MIELAQRCHCLARRGLGPAYPPSRKREISHDLGARVSGSDVVRFGTAFEVLKAEASFFRATLFQQQRGALGDACCNEPWPTAAFSERLGFSKYRRREIILHPMLRDPRKDEVRTQRAFNRASRVDRWKPIAEKQFGLIQTALFVKNLSETMHAGRAARPLACSGTLSAIFRASDANRLAVDMLR